MHLLHGNVWLQEAEINRASQIQTVEELYIKVSHYFNREESMTGCTEALAMIQSASVHVYLQV